MAVCITFLDGQFDVIVLIDWNEKDFTNLGILYTKVEECSGLSKYYDGFYVLGK